MGESLGGPCRFAPKGHFEDLDLRKHLYAYDQEKVGIEEFREFFRSRYAQRDIWGIKNPALCWAINDLAPLLRDYRVIRTERDVLACVHSYDAHWSGTNPGMTFLNHVRMRRLVDRFMEAHRPPAITVSFNELSEDPDRCVRSIAEFAFDGRRRPSEDTIAAAIDMVDPSLNHRRELDVTWEALH